MGVVRLVDLASAAGARVEGPGELEIRAVRPLAEAEADHLSFVTSPGYRDAAQVSRAGALLVSPEVAPLLADRPLLVAEDPYLGLAKILAYLHPEPSVAAGVHPTAVVDDDAAVDESASIGPFAVVGAGSQIEAGVVVRAHSVIGERCLLGEGSVLHPHVTLYDGTVLGARTILHAGAVIGADGFGYAESAGARIKLPQVGTVEVGEDVEIGANSTVDRATLTATRIGAGTKVDNLVQIGHNVVLGRGCILCGQVGISGSATLGDGVVMGGQSGSAGHLSIGDGAQVAAKTAVFQGVEAGATVAGIPAQPIAGWRRQAVGLQRLDDLRRRVRHLEKVLEERDAERVLDEEKDR